MKTLMKKPSKKEILNAKIVLAKLKEPIVLKIVKLEKEIQKMEKCISKKRDKISILSKAL